MPVVRRFATFGPFRIAMCAVAWAVTAGPIARGEPARGEPVEPPSVELPRSEPVEPPIDHPPALTPAEAVRQFKLPDDLTINLVVAEPLVSQPLSVCFDDRGRMWVLQYRQYPNPNGLTPVSMDEWLRTKYDRVPDPPPLGPTGQDRISIYEDTDGDGQAELVTDFVNDLNLASGFALGYDGVFVVQSPYLLFYPDLNRDDRPDGPPEVLLKGFGMEDAHAFANSLTWGPDGWLYGCQGSTATALIRGIGFQQGVWRYHPRTRAFELFAEGGGNSWGVEFDRHGNLFAAGNEVELLVHHVQGAYYVKGFGKHGPLHNPHAYGYFQPVLHHGYAGDSLSGGAILYQGGAFPEKYHNACLAPNTRHSACRWGTVELRGSTFATRAAGDFILSEDIWFRPVDMTCGPDGAVYVCDWYDYNISHSSPLNRSQWYQPSRLDGRVWRVAPPGLPTHVARQMDLGTKTSAELVELLNHPNDWYARQARRLLAERRDRAIVPAVTQLALTAADERMALEGLWSLYVVGGLDEGLAAQLLVSQHEYVRAWTVRLLGDMGEIPASLLPKCVALAGSDPSVIVRSQLACTAKRLAAGPGLALVKALVARSEDLEDVHVPLLLWWAVESKAISDTALVLGLFESQGAWRLPLVEQVLVERLARRFMADASPAGYAAAAEFLKLTPTEADTRRVLAGFLLALSGQRLGEVPPPLAEAVDELLADVSRDAQALELGLRMTSPVAAARAVTAIADPSWDEGSRLALIKSLGETRTPVALSSLLGLVGSTEGEPVQLAAVAALGYFQDPAVAQRLLSQYGNVGGAVQASTLELLCSRGEWARLLVAAIDGGSIAPTALSLAQVRRLRDFDDPSLAESISRHWGRVQATTPLEKQGRITAVSQMLGRAAGDATQGRVHYEKVCANCHKLHGMGEVVGPDLTGAERRNLDLLVRNVVDPSAVIREQYITHVATTVDGRVLTGLLAESTEQTVTLLDAKNKRTVLERAEIEELAESPGSLMPDNLLDALTQQQIRDLFAYLQAELAPQ